MNTNNQQDQRDHVTLNLPLNPNSDDVSFEIIMSSIVNATEDKGPSLASCGESYSETIAIDGDPYIKNFPVNHCYLILYSFTVCFGVLQLGYVSTANN